MSLQLEFEPHSWYKGWAIEKTGCAHNDITNWEWNAYTDDGMYTYAVLELHATTLKQLKNRINEHINYKSKEQ